MRWCCIKSGSITARKDDPTICCAPPIMNYWIGDRQAEAVNESNVFLKKRSPFFRKKNKETSHAGLTAVPCSVIFFNYALWKKIDVVISRSYSITSRVTTRYQCCST
ncbi:hypothetical protein RvY_04313 [Ramazzottius varieornatus]|uniref:Uncharacterized protein n=1 Tax=Ramazzottius varieornatus TaxID=947166 RepID=A0A1D1UUL3_RAMVA|nr:hypothetical protein RvY_04313 [Ramazzottius varieornatus]